MIEKDNMVLQPTWWLTIQGLWIIQQTRIRQIPHKRGDLGAHAMLFSQNCLWITCKDHAFEEGTIQVIAFTFLNGESIVVDLGFAVVDNLQ